MAASVKHFKQVGKIRGWRQMAFILGLAERSLPNLVLGVDVFGIDMPVNPSLVITALWNGITESEPGISQKSAATLTNQLTAVLNRLAELQEYGARPAGDAAKLLSMALELHLNADQSLAKEAAELSFNTVTGFIEFSEGEGLEEHELVTLFDKHPLIKQELGFQRSLQKVLSASEHASEIVEQIRQLASNNGTSNIGISLDGE